MNDRAVYLSFRRSYSCSLALSLFHGLQVRGFDVFIDAGEYDLRDSIDLAEIESRPHFLIVLTPCLIESLQNSDDPMWREIEQATHTRRNIVPLLTNGFSFSSGFMPAELGVLRRDHALTITLETLADAPAVLDADYLRRPIFGTLVPASPESQAAAERRVAEAASQLLPTDAELRAEVMFNHAHGRSRHDQAGRIADFDEVLRLNPEHIHARFDRALARRRIGDESGAVEDYNEVLRRSPHFYKAYNDRAELYFARGSYNHALADYEQATALNADYTLALAGKAVTLHALGHVDEALSLWKPLVANDDRYFDAIWVGRELRLPTAMIDEIDRLTLRLRPLADVSDD